MSAAQKLNRLAAVIAPAAALAATCGHMGWSDANLKQQIEPSDGLDRLRQL